ncbi:MAG: hypothetical protein NTAFB01_41840 [Nitrospira sp.]
MQTEIIKDACEKSVTKNMPFPEVIKQLAEAGVESYYADLNQLQKIYYASNGKAFVVDLKTQPLGMVAEQFDANAVKQALQDIREKKIGYTEFLRQIVAAGTLFYTVHIRGRRVLYVGRFGDFHVEHFPAAKP